MEIQQLRYFVTLSRELNFSRAARLNYVTQPTLSQQLKKLEQELGTALFERSSHGVRLTAQGERFLPHATSILERLEIGVSEIQENIGKVTGTVRLATIPTMAPYLLPKLIQKVKRLAPELTLEIFEETTSLLVEDLKSGKLDLGVLSLPITDSGLVSRSLGMEDFYLAVSKNHPLSKKKSITPKQLEEEKLLILQEGHCFSDQALSYCEKHRKDESIIFQGSSLTSVMRLAATSEGITLVPEMAVDTKANPDLRFISFSKPKPRRELGILWRVTTPLTPKHRLLIKVLEEITS